MSLGLLMDVLMSATLRSCVKGMCLYRMFLCVLKSAEMLACVAPFTHVHSPPRPKFS